MNGTVQQVTFMGYRLWCLGDTRLLNDYQRPIAIVGARGCSDYGAQVAHRFASELAAPPYGHTIVSGLARGIDGWAHRGALEAEGATIAVLGCGIDYVYPSVHQDLYERIAETGLIVSEYAPGTPPAPWRFPARNKVIATIATGGMVVVEARERSGALIAADFALELKRSLWAVPGEITSNRSFGPNDLLRRGIAKAAVAVEDIAA